MKKRIKLTAAALAAIAAMSCVGLTAYADRIKTVDGVAYRYSDSGEQKGTFSGWAKTSKGKRYYKNGVLYKDRWIKTKSGKRYYAGSDGYLVTGWRKFNGKWHWFDPNGAETVGTLSIGGVTYNFSASGEWDGYSGLDTGTTMYALTQKISADIYGGIYNDSGVITVLATDTEAARRTISELYPESIQIIVRPCRFTFGRLSEVKDKINENLDKYDVVATIDIVNNYVSVAGNFYSDKFQKFIKDNGFNDCTVCDNDLNIDD